MLAQLEKNKHVVEHKESVHAGTLTAFVKEQMGEGNNIPMDLLGVFEYSKTKITRKGA